MKYGCDASVPTAKISGNSAGPWSGLNAVGQFPLQAYFGVFTDSTHAVTHGFTRPEAVLNLLVLTACIAIALFATDRYLRWQARRA